MFDDIPNMRLMLDDIRRPEDVNTVEDVVIFCIFTSWLGATMETLLVKSPSWCIAWI